MHNAFTKLVSGIAELWNNGSVGLFDSFNLFQQRKRKSSTARINSPTRSEYINIYYQTLFQNQAASVCHLLLKLQVFYQ